MLLRWRAGFNPIRVLIDHMLMCALLVSIFFITSLFVSFGSLLIFGALVIIFIIVFKLVVRGLFRTLLVDSIFDGCCVLSS